MQREFHNIGQNNDDWLDMRLGRFTASTFKDLFMGPKTATHEKAIYKPVFERLTGEAPESFSSAYMERGHALEPFAVESYEMETFRETSNGGFWTYGDWIGASPDRMVGSDGILEAKCPAFNTIMNYLLKEELPPVYKWQVHGQMHVTDRDWCDFISYHPQFKLLIVRVHRDEKTEAELIKKLSESIEKAESIFNQLKRAAA